MIRKLVLVVLSCVVISTLKVYGEDFVELGVILPFTGKNKKFGEFIQKGALIAVEDFNSQGGFQSGPWKGKKLKLVFIDDESRSDRAAEIAKKFIEEKKYPLILGGYSSSESFKIAEVSAERGIPYICQTGSTDKLTRQGWENVFRINPTSTMYIGGLIDFLEKVVKPKTVAILYYDNSYGKSAAEGMRRFCKEKNIEIVFDSPYSPTTNDFRALLLKIKIKNPDVVYLVSYLMDAILIAQQAVELNLHPKLFAGAAAGFAIPDFPKGAGEAAENFMTAALWAPDVKYPGVEEFTKTFEEKYNMTPTYHAAEGYALIRVATSALERTHSLEAEDIISALKDTDIMTPFGPVKFKDFNGYTHQNRLKTLVMQVQGGKLVTVWPEEIATRKYIYPLP